MNITDKELSSNTVSQYGWNLGEFNHSTPFTSHFIYITDYHKDNTWMITIISLMIIMGVIYYIYKNRPSNNIENIGYGMVIGGALGNFIDRIIYGYVIDFIDINLFGWNYPVFNIADMMIVIGVFLLVINAWRCKNVRG